MNECMPETLSGKSAWENYKLRRRRFFLVWLGYIPGVLVVGHGFGALFEIAPPYAPIAAIWMAPFAVTGWQLSYFRCPACGESFFRSRLMYNPFACKCVHCGLPKWQGTGN
jgi:hypothetical protein